MFKKIKNLNRLFRRKLHKYTLGRFFFPDDTKLKVEAKTSAFKNKQGKVVVHREFYTLRSLASFCLWYLTKNPYEKTKKILEDIKYKPEYQFKFAYTFGIILLATIGDIKNLSNFALIGGAIAFDATSYGSFTTETTLTFAHTCTGSNLVLAVGASSYNTAFSGCTYNSAAMTSGVSQNYGGGSLYNIIYYKASPSTGSNNVVVSGDNMMACAVSFSGANTASPIGASANIGHASSLTSENLDITTSYANSFLIDIFSCQPTYTGSVWAAYTGQTQRRFEDEASHNFAYGCSTKPTTTTGTYNMRWDKSSGDTPYRTAMVILEIRELAIVAPTVSTSAVSDKATTSGTGNGNITATGGANATRRGFCYKQGTTGDPTTADSVAYDDGDYGTGTYTKSITGLSAGTAYRVRAYAVNSAGTGYGSTVDYVTTYDKTLTETPKIAQPSPAKLSGKTFSAIVSVVPALTKAGVFYKIYSEAIIIIGNTLKQTVHTFIESIKTSDIYIKTLSAIKIITETVIIISNLFFNISRIFIDRFIVVPVQTTVLSAVKVLSEALQVIGSKIVSVGRTFTENVIVNDILSNIKILNEMLSETIIVISNKIVDFSKTFIERLVVISSLVIQWLKTFTESFVVVDTITKVLNSSRVFTETIIVNWAKLTYRAYTVSIQRIVMGTVSFIKTPNKVLIDRIVGTTNWLFEKTQFIELTDVVNVISLATKQAGKTFTASLNVIGSIISSTSKTFVETIIVVENFVIARAYYFYETVVAGGTFILGTISKLFTETFNVKIIFTEGRNAILTETIVVADTIISIGAKVLNEVVNVIGALGGFVAGKLLIETPKTTDTNTFKKTQYKVLTDTVSAVSGAFNETGKIFSEVLSAVDSLGSWAIGKMLVDPVKVIPNYTSAWTLSRVYNETLIVIGNGYNEGQKIFIEVLTISGEFILGTISKVLVEVVKVYDVIQKSLPKVFSETLSVIGNSLNQGILVFTEIVSVIGEFVLGTISKVFFEPIIVAYEHITAGTFYKQFTEIVQVIGKGFNQGLKIFTENITVSVSFLIDGLAKTFYETVVMTSNLSRDFVRVFTQFIIASEQTIQSVYSKIFIEIASIVNPNALKANGKIFVENMKIGWSKIKLVLNGIQVGLWKKVARITTGAWKKVSRNDN